MDVMYFSTLGIEVSYLVAGMTVPVIVHKIFINRMMIVISECLTAVLMICAWWFLLERGYLLSTRKEQCLMIAFCSGLDCDWRIEHAGENSFMGLGFFLKWFVAFVFLEILEVCVFVFEN